VAVQVAEHVATGLVRQPGVVARDPGVAQNHVVVRRPAEGGGFFQSHLLRLLARLLHHQLAEIRHSHLLLVGESGPDFLITDSLIP